MSKVLLEGLHKSIADALWYLDRPGTSPEDEAKAKAILRVRTDAWKPGAAEAIAVVPPVDKLLVGRPLKDRQLALWVGHEPGGGAEGEREWNIELAQQMSAQVESLGGEARVFYHKLRAYGARQTAMRRTMLAEMPEADLAFELHYDAVHYPSAHGHHFQYRGAKALAGAIRDRWQVQFPNSRARHDNGILRNLKGNGAGFLRKCPCWAVLTEPFFRSNPEEWDFFRDKQTEVAQVYVLGAAGFLTEQAA